MICPDFQKGLCVGTDGMSICLKYGKSSHICAVCFDNRHGAHHPAGACAGPAQGGGTKVQRRRRRWADAHNLTESSEPSVKRHCSAAEVASYAHADASTYVLVAGDANTTIKKKYDDNEGVTMQLHDRIKSMVEDTSINPDTSFRKECSEVEGAPMQLREPRKVMIEDTSTDIDTLPVHREGASFALPSGGCRWGSGDPTYCTVAAI